MTEPLPLTEFETEVRHAQAVPGPSPAFVSRLQSRLAERAAARRAARRPPAYRRLAWAGSLALVLVLGLAFLAIGPQQVLAAVKGLLGYVPDIGQVRLEGGLRVLEGTGPLERQGIRLTVERGAADSQQTIVVYRVEGLTIAAANSQGEAAATGGVAALLLPDGSVLSFTGGSSTGWGTGYESRLVFPPLPPAVMQATLLVSRLDSMPAGAAPEDWRVPLRFQPAPPDLKVMPVYEIATARPAVPRAGPTAIEPAAPAGREGIQVSLEKVAELEDGYLLQGSFSWEGLDPAASAGLDQDPHIIDANGQTIPSELDYSSGTAQQPGGRRQAWAVRTISKAYPGPWQMVFPSMMVYLQADLSFELDLGANPQPGQAWVLNWELQVGGQTAILKQVVLSRDSAGVFWLEFTVDGRAGEVNISLLDQDNHSSRIAGRGGPGDNGTTLQAFSYDQKPSGVHHLLVNAVSYLLKGPWQLSWTPPVAAGQPQPTPTAAPLSCLVEETWSKLKSQPAAVFPQGLDGRLLLETYTGQLMPQLSLVPLDGSQPTPLAVGGWSSLSPDGSTLAYIASMGPSIFLADAKSGKTWPLPGSTPDDYHPMWSPDGQWMAFVRGTQGIFVQRLDGSDQKQVTTPQTLSFLVGWIPDSQGLVITTLGASGSQVQLLNLKNDARQELFTIENAKGGFVQLSPDGQRVVFTESIFGKFQAGVWVAALDGTGKRLLVSLDTAGPSATVWSPDGKWLALTLDSSTGSKVQESVFLLQPDTCQLLALPLQGRVSGWSAGAGSAK